MKSLDDFGKFRTLRLRGHAQPNVAGKSEHTVLKNCSNLNSFNFDILLTNLGESERYLFHHWRSAFGQGRMQKFTACPIG